jgi:uncharacterized protein YhaN
MRIRQLDLLRYGHFTDVSIALPASTPDIHMVLGENEAGKSTSMAGAEDLLFGIPANSPRNFLHEYAAMRVGAILEKGGDALRVRRRKGNKDTLLSEHDLPVPSGEGTLAPYLAGADRAFHTRMFSLDHHRLRQGGKEILQAQDDIGQMLFSASAGITGLRDSLKAMEAEANALWASRRAAHRKYFQAEERLKFADASMREPRGILHQNRNRAAGRDASVHIDRMGWACGDYPSLDRIDRDLHRDFCGRPASRAGPAACVGAGRRRRRLRASPHRLP